jgi:hypothetical protein
VPPSSSSRVSPVGAERDRGPVYSPCFRLLLEMAVPWCPDLDFRLGPMPGDATSSDQVLAVRGKQGAAVHRTGGLTPPPVIYGEPLPLFDSNRGAGTSAREIYGLWGRPALRDPLPAQALRAASS